MQVRTEHPMVKRKDNVARVRNGILSAVAVVIAVVVGYGLYYGLGFSSNNPYVALDKPDATGEVEVIAYFSYVCPHCRSLEKRIDGWRPGLPDGVAFDRVHVSYSVSNRLLAKAYRTLVRHDALHANHERLFRAIHDRNRQFNTPAELADFVDGHGIDRETFLRTMASSRIAREVAVGERRFVDLGLASVPALVVDDKYIVNMGVGRKQALNVAEDLVRELLAKRAGG